MKFKEYLQEKTSKKEYKEALENDDIKAGCEFEFYLDEDNRSHGYIDQEKIDNLEKKSDKQIDNVNNNLNAYYEAYNDGDKRVTEEIPDEIDEIDDKISNLEDENLDYQDHIDDLQDEIDDLEDANPDKITSLNKEIKQTQDSIDYNDNEIDELNDKKDDLEDEQREFDNGEFQDNLIDEYQPIPSTYDLSYFFDIVDYLEDDLGMYVGGINDQERNEKLFRYFENGEELPYTNGLFNDIFGYYLSDITYDNNNDEDPTDDEMEELDFPVSLSGMEVKKDGSLGDGGVEIATDIEELPDLIDIIEKVFKWIEEVGYTNKDTGFHVHMSLDKGYPIDPLKLLLFIEEGKIFEKFQERIGSQWAASIMKGHFDYLKPFNVDDLKKLANKERPDKQMNIYKYLGVHLIDLEHNHVEFRYLGGKDYSKKFKDIKDVIANYAHWMSIANDPNYKSKEYIKKLNRIVNYYNYLYLFNYIKEFLKLANKISLIEIGVSEAVWKKNLKIELKPYKQQLSNIPRPKSSKTSQTELIEKSTQKAKDDFKLFLSKRFNYKGK